MTRTAHSAEQVLAKMREKAVPENRLGMARFGIDTEKALGISMPNIRGVGKEIIKDHSLAQELWDSGIHEVRILASIVDHPKWVSPQQMDQWVLDFNSWDLCDQVCGNLFNRSKYAHEKILIWAEREEEYVKRAAFALIAWRSVHDKKEENSTFIRYLPLIETASNDSRNFVKKAVNWALRQIGKRSVDLHGPALELALDLAQSPDATARWIGKDAIKEFESTKLRQRLGI